MSDESTSRDPIERSRAVLVSEWAVAVAMRATLDRDICEARAVAERLAEGRE
jgi:hypothetical protein